MPVVAAVAGMTIITGNLMAIPQHNIKRLLAYSGIAHIGYMLVGLAALTTNGIAMVLFYLVAYLFGNMGAFFVVEAVARSENSEEIDAYKGLAQRSPLLALAMLVFLLSLGGIPFVAGFWAKLYVFLAAIDRGMYGLVFLGAVLTVVALYYYLLVARRMYIEEPVQTGRIKVSPLLGPRDSHLHRGRGRHGRLAGSMGDRDPTRRRRASSPSRPLQRSSACNNDDRRGRPSGRPVVCTWGPTLADLPSRFAVTVGAQAIRVRSRIHSRLQFDGAEKRWRRLVVHRLLSEDAAFDALARFTSPSASARS
jgi:hypothetical protein